MTTTSAPSNGSRQKFQALLRDLFQFDSADLDFGIYRIMNHKRDAINSFIDGKLPSAISSALGSGRLVEQQRNEEALAEARRKIIETAELMGITAFSESGDLAPDLNDTPIGQDYLQAQRAAQGGRGSDAVEVSIYNHLYTFFSRYYQDGDFISKRRYSRNQKYAIPYNGEEVYLHWANSDQYYVKTDEHFKNYDWNAPNGVAVHFRVQDANVEQNNVQGDRRFFLPIVKGVAWDSDTRSVDIPFEYRPLTASEKREYGSRNQQDKIIAAAVSAIPKRIGSAAPDAISALADEHRVNAKGEPVSRLEHHLRRYTQRNDSDFFIHKDLKAFLLRELDFYLKNELLNLDEISAAGEVAAEGWFQQMRLMKDVGGKVIDFLAQIENFQKTLWEKKKFVVDTQYCVTLGNVSAELHAEIVENDAQWDEWRDLMSIDADDRSAAVMKSHPTLMLDTRHFSTDFTNRLLASFDELDDVTDGLLIHSENWQALRLLQEKYHSSVQCVYIDPPYNSKTSEILYKNTYRHSSWLSLIDNRLSISQPLATPTGSHIVAIDENEQVYLGRLMMQRFPDHNNICVSIVHNKKGIQGDHLSYNHDFAYFSIPLSLKSTNGQKISEEDWKYVQLRKWGRESERSTAKNCFYPIFVKSGKIVGYGEVCDDSFHPGNANVFDSEDTDLVSVYPVDRNGIERKWRYARDSVERISYLLKAHTTRNGEVQIHKANDEQQFKTVWSDSRYIAGDYGTKWLTNLGLKVEEDLYPKSIYTVEDSIYLSSEADSLTLDYFAGSGTTAHAAINLNREDNGQRKFILVEMGDYFHTVLLPRVKKITYTPDWTEGKPKRPATPEEAERSPRVVKYMRLESYEDALDCIAFDAHMEQMRLEERIEDYLIKYMLDMETRNSDTLLNVRKLTHPFSYKLRSHANGETREQKADIAETFNYLLGLNVRTRRVYDDSGRCYLVYRGETREAPGKKVAVIWRETEGWTKADYEQDRDFVLENKLIDGADTAYINGTSCIPGATELEPLFRARMFAPVTA